jgi:hypothetical protein
MSVLPDARLATPPARLIRADPTNRFLLDQSNTPFLMMGDSPHCLLTAISLDDAAQYMALRAAQGFNTLGFLELLCNAAVGGQSNGSTYDGIVPFLGTVDGTHYDFTQPNPAYFSRVYDMLALAAKFNFLVMLVTMEFDGWTATMEANGSANCTAWGTYLARTFSHLPHIIWLMGNDFQTWSTSSTDNALATAIMAAISAGDSRHLQTTELDYNISKSSDNTSTAAYVTLAAAYTYYPTYGEVSAQYAANAGPVFMEEGYYEGATYGGLTPTSLTNLGLRKQAYWTLLAGGLAGYMHGTAYYDFHAGWQSGIVTTLAAHLGYWRALFASLAWWKLVPDTAQAVCTSGYGTATGTVASSTPPSTGNGRIDTDNYVTTAAASDGSLVVAYLPQGGSPIIAMATLRGTTTARWFDPTTGIFSTVSGSPFANTGSHTFTPSGNNAAGDPDWVLVLTA